MTDPAEGIAPFDPADAAGDAGAEDRPAWRQPALVVIAILCLIPEAVLTGADMQLWGQTRWRTTALEYAGFWTGLLGNWQPNYPFQPVAMFVTYGFLHAGFSHFAVNMLTLFSLGDAVIARVGQARFILIYTVALLGGALGFALLSRDLAPMIGASGALFGLAGALLCWEYAARRRAHRSMTPIWRSAIMLTGLNLILWWAMAGQLAWQTHLGGFLAGGLAALVLGTAKSAPEPD